MVSQIHQVQDDKTNQNKYWNDICRIRPMVCKTQANDAGKSAA